MTQSKLIADSEALQSFCQKLGGSPWLTIDTEFLREKTYYAQLCLIQVANTEVAACIDPQAFDTPEALQPLMDLMFDESIVKVFHASRQDLEIFCDLTGKLPKPVFDTQIAATLTGHGDQIGYANLVEKVLGVRLAKTQSRTDWSARPLSDDQIDYALDDVTYLRDIYLKLDAALHESGRIEWLQDDFNALSDPKTYQPDGDTLWRKLKGSNKLHGVQLAALQRLAAWREEVAKEINRPRRWVLKDEVMVDLARFMPKEEKALTRLRGLESGTLKRHGKTLFDLIESARKSDKSSWPTLTDTHARLTPDQDALVDALMTVIRLASAEHGVSATTLATRKEIAQLVCGNQSVQVLTGWRRVLAGNSLLEFMAGECHLHVNNHQLRLSRD